MVARRPPLAPSAPAVRGGVVAVLLALLAVASAFGGKAPSVIALQEGRGQDGGHVVLLVGKGLKKIKRVALYREDDSGIDDDLTMVDGAKGDAFVLPVDLLPGRYRFEFLWGRKEVPLPPITVDLRLGSIGTGSIGRSTLTSALSSDLDDVVRLRGKSQAFFRDASNLQAGRFPAALLDARADLSADGHVDGRGLLAPADYSAWEDLDAEGHVDGKGNLTTDDFSAADDLIAESRTDAGGVFPLAAFSAFDSLSARNELGTAAGTVARGAHDHFLDHIPFEGGSLEGALTIEPAGTAAKALSLSESAQGFALATIRGTTDGAGVGLRSSTKWTGGSATPSEAVYGYATGSTGANIGVLGVTRSSEGIGVQGNTGANGDVAVYATTASNGLGVGAEHRGGGTVMSVSLTHPGNTRDAFHIDQDGSGEILVMSTDDGPVARIDNDGKGYFNGGIATSGADLAEMVRVRDVALLEAGDVIVIDRAAERGFARSAGANSTLVAGVFSTKPALVGSLHAVAGDDLPEDEIPLGIRGIVPTKVCDENGPIAAGDFLVTSTVPGHAMKAPADPKPGTVLGRALGTLEKGRGRIEVMVRLR